MPNSIKSKILIESENKFFHLGDIIIRVKKGEIYYKPSQRPIVILNEKESAPLEHFSWHSSGGVYLKLTNGKHVPIEIGVEEILKNGERQTIKDIGYQELFRQIGFNFSVLPVVQRADKDVILNGKNHPGSFIFLFSIVSGTHIVASNLGKETPVKFFNADEKPLRLDTKHGCLGAESNNADKLLQYYLEKYLPEVQEGKCFFILASDTKIKKISYD